MGRGDAQIVVRQLSSLLFLAASRIGLQTQCSHIKFLSMTVWLYFVSSKFYILVCFSNVFFGSRFCL